jgi:hypothetical protein
MTDELQRALREHQVRLVAKADSRLMRVLALLLPAAGTRGFQERYWTTLGRSIYYPTSVRDPLAHRDVLEHELVHVRQWHRYGVLLWISYLLLPVPFGLAWFRFRWEREAYLVQIARATDRDREIARVVDALWFGYGRPWPRAWMRRWFERHAPRSGSDIR